MQNRLSLIRQQKHSDGLVIPGEDTEPVVTVPDNALNRYIDPFEGMYVSGGDYAFDLENAEQRYSNMHSIVRISPEHTWQLQQNIEVTLRLIKQINAHPNFHVTVIRPTYNEHDGMYYYIIPDAGHATKVRDPQNKAKPPIKADGQGNAYVLEYPGSQTILQHIPECNVIDSSLQIHVLRDNNRVLATAYES